MVIGLELPQATLAIEELSTTAMATEFRRMVAFTGATLQAMDRIPTAAYCDVVTLLSTWHPGGNRQTPARPS
jgi:hypothetical protein